MIYSIVVCGETNVDAISTNVRDTNIHACARARVKITCGFANVNDICKRILLSRMQHSYMTRSTCVASCNTHDAQTRDKTFCFRV